MARISITQPGMRLVTPIPTTTLRRLRRPCQSARDGAWRRSDSTRACPTWRMTHSGITSGLINSRRPVAAEPWCTLVPLSIGTRLSGFPTARSAPTWPGEEKGIDVRIAVDVVSLAWQHAFDVVLIFSQDQDLSEVAREIRDIARRQDRWIKIASAFPVSPAATNRKGINWTDWIRIDRETYDSCLDPRDDRPKKPPTTGGAP